MSKTSFWHELLFTAAGTADHVANLRALNVTPRRGLRRLTVDVSEDDLHAIAKRGYEGAVTTDHDQQAQAVGLFLTDALLQI